jgi:hypothetical protein
MLSRAKGQIWEEGFFDHILRSKESYSQKWNYVRENPVRRILNQQRTGLTKERLFTSIAPDLL